MITNYLTEMIECLRPDTDEHEYDAYVLDEHSPENLDPDMVIFNTEIDE